MSYPVDITAYRQEDGRVRLVRENAGPLRVSSAVLDEPIPEVVSVVLDLITFHGVDEVGRPVAYRYRIVGHEAAGPNRWLLCDPVGDAD